MTAAATERVRIARITIDGVKAYDRVADIGRATLVTGPVESGKSALLDGLRFAALGFVPHLGRRESDTARIRRGDRMLVRVDLTDGRWFTRTLERRGKADRTNARTSWLPADALSSEHAEAIRGLFGESDEEAAEHLDLRELLAATPAQIAGRIETLLAATAAKPGEVVASLRALTVARLAKLDEERIPAAPAARDALVEGLLPSLEAGRADAVGRAMVTAGDELRARGLPGALAWANEEKRLAAERVAKKTKAREALEDRARSLAVPAGTLDDLGRRRQGLSDRLAVVREGFQRFDAGATARRAAQDAVAKARAAAADHAAAKETVAEARAAAARLRAEADAIVDPAEVPPPALVETDPDVRARADELTDRARKAEDAAIEPGEPPAPPRLLDLPSTEAKTEALNRAHEDLAAANEDPWVRVAEIVDALASFERSADVDPLYEELRGLAKENGADVAGAEHRLRQAELALKDVERQAADVAERNLSTQREYDARHAEWEAKRAAAARQRDEARRLREDARALWQPEIERVAAANTKARSDYAAAVGKRSAAIDENRRRRAALLDSAAKNDAAALADEQDIAREDGDLREAEARLAGIGAAEPFDAEGAKAEIDSISGEIAAIDVQREALEGADARKREIETLAYELLAAQADRDTLTALEWAMQRLREKDLASRGGPLMERMRRYLRAAGCEDEPYLRATKTATEFGVVRGGQEIAVAAMSGRQTAVYLTGLAGAIIALRAPELPVLLVEAAEVGAGAPPRSLMAGIDALGDEIGNAIVATCIDVEAPAGWTTIRTDARAAAAVAR